MLVIPAIDLKNGKCVRLMQGRADRETVYGADPLAMAWRFQQSGARMLHVVDLDGAFNGRAANLDAIAAIAAEVGLPIELGGGMRTMDDIDRALALGIDSVIVGTMAAKEPELFEEAIYRFGGERLQLGVDAREGKVAVHGWMDATELDAIEFAREWKERGVERAIFTDIARDGMMTGPNVEAIRGFARGTGLRVTASGGVASPEDLERLAALEPLGVDRAIVGKALYEGTVQLAEVVRY